MATAQGFGYAYSVTIGTGGAISVDPNAPKVSTASKPITVTDTGTDDTSRLGDVANDGVTVTALNNTTSTYYGSAVVNGQYGIIIADQNNKWLFLTDAQFAGTAPIAGTATQGGTWTLAGTGAPAAPTSLALASDTGSSGTDKITSVATINGTAAAGSTVTLKIGAATVGSGTADASGNFSITPTSGLVQGSNTVSVTSTTSGGTSNSSNFSFTYDTGTPAAPTVGSVADNVGAIQGNLTNGGVTDDTTLQLSGTAEAGAIVGIYNNGTLIGTTTAGGGNWSFTTSALSGPVSLTARATDAAGNQSAASTAFTTTVDTAAPAAPASVALVQDTGTAGDNVTSNPAIKGVAEAGSTVTLKVGNVVVGTGTADAQGNFSITPTGLAQGQNTLSVTATDAAGNTGTATNIAFTYDTAAPGAPAIASVTDNVGATQGALANGAATDDTTLALSGTAEANATVQVFNGTILVGTTVASGNGAWSLTTSALPAGSVSLTAKATDAAGNQGAASAAFTATVDTAAPGAPTSVALVADTGAAGDGVTSNPAIKGVAEAGSTVTLKVGSTVVGIGTADASGNFSITPTGLAQGANTVTVTATDAAGNTGAATNIAFTYDAAAPGAPAIGAVSDNAGLNQGNLASGGVTDDTTLTLSGTAEAGATVNVYNGATLVGTATAAGDGAWSLTTSALPEGAVSLTARASDAAGNQGAASTAFTTTVDTTPPAATATVALAQDTGASAGDGTTSDPALAGTGPANATLVIKDGAAVVGTVTAGADGTWTFANAGAAEGTHSYTVQVADAAGNLGPASGALSVTLDKTAPAATTTIALAQDTGAAGDGATSDPTLAGTVSSLAAGVTVTVYDGGTAIGTATTGSGGAWSFTPTGTAAGDGSHSYTAAVTDAAGNSGSVASTSPAVTAVDKAADADVSVDLTDAAATATTASVSFTLSSLDAGSTATVTFTGSGGGSVVRAYTGNGAQIADVSGLTGDVTAAVQVTDRAGNQAAGTGDTLAADPVCFYPGTLVATPSGERPVEALKAGDLVLTAEGEAKPVRWLGRQTVSTRFGDPLRVLPVRIVAGALGENLPKRDLLVSADHALLVDGVLIQAGALVNGTTVRREADVPEVFTYWHVELADHSLVLAEGVAAETFVDNVARMAFDNWAEHEAADAPAPVAEMALPRAKAARQVPEAARRRLAGRAALLLLGGRAATAAA